MELLNVSAWPDVVCNAGQFHATISFPGGAAAADIVQKELCTAAVEYPELPERIVNSLSFTNLIEDLINPVHAFPIRPSFYVICPPMNCTRILIQRKHEIM